MLSKLINIIESPMKSLIATITGTITGYIPLVTNNIMNIPTHTVDTFFQHGVWTVTILVALASLVSFIQKQLDRWEDKKVKKHIDIYNYDDEDEYDNNYK